MKKLKQTHVSTCQLGESHGAIGGLCSCLGFIKTGSENKTGNKKDSCDQIKGTPCCSHFQFAGEGRLGLSGGETKSPKNPKHPGRFISELRERCLNKIGKTNALHQLVGGCLAKH